MKLGILITTYNRPAYLKECLDSLKRADIPQGTEIAIVDDCSNDPLTLQLINASGYTVIKKAKNKGIRDSMLIGCNYLFAQSCDVVMNLDSDAVVRNDFIECILGVHTKFSNDIVTGFNCLTKNNNGTERHKVLEGSYWYNVKRSVGGINMCFSFSTYQEHIKPALLIPGNWDHNACISAGRAICVVPSVVQHIGIVSSMGHTSVEKPDIAEDFKGLHLKDVTLVCVDDDYERACHAIMQCCKDIEFAKIQNIHPCPALNSKRAYSEFIMHELHKYIETSHVLVVQHDGYVKNWKAWDKNWLQYDYIGAPWEWYRDGMNVGNGGFVLKSRRLMELCKDLPLKNDKDINDFQSDHNICRIYRPYLESKGIKFAPIDVARKFSIEAWRSPNNKYAGQFGFHGMNVKFT